MKSPERLITIGKVLKTRGVEGLLAVAPLTFNPDRFFALQEAWFVKGHDASHESIHDISVASGFVFLRVRGIDSPEKARTFIGCEIRVPESESPAPPEGAYYHHQIIGLAVYTERGRYLGIVREIIETGSNDVYAVEDQGKEVLVPAIEDVVSEIDLASKKIIVKETGGLLDDS